MSREFNFEPFKANEPILDQLTASRLNAMLDAISRNRVEFGDNITGTRTPGGTIVRGNPAPPSAALENYYDFEAFDATDEDGHKVTIMDGLVYGPNDNGTVPSGMGSDDFTIAVSYDAEEVFLIITQNIDTLDVVSITFGTGATTPDDTDSVTYVTICTIEIDESDNLIPHNTLCGDYVLPFGELSIEDEDGGTADSVDDILVTTEGDDYINVNVSQSGPGAAQISITSSDNLVALDTRISALEAFNAAIEDCDDG